MPTVKKTSRISHISIVLLGIVSVLLFAVWWFVYGAPSVAQTKTVDLSSMTFEIAATNEARTHGLSDRENLDRYSGMLFIFDQPGIYPFWMKDMHFPLDIIWMDGDRVVDVVTLPPPKPTDPVPPTHIPPHIADTVLEINAGIAAQLGLKDGVRVILPK